MTSHPAGSLGGPGMGFDRHLILTHPDHQSLVLLWKKLVSDSSRVLAKGEAGILARLSEGLPAGYVQMVVESVVKV